MNNVPMRRSRQALTQAENTQVLERGKSGVLALCSKDGMPYALPISYVLHEGNLYFHCATTGHKIDLIRENPRASFCVTDEDNIVPEEFTTYFRSVIASGRMEIITEPDEMRRALIALSGKYSPGLIEETKKTIDNAMGRVCVLRLTPEHISGKEAIEYVKNKQDSPVPDGEKEI